MKLIAAIGLACVQPASISCEADGFSVTISESDVFENPKKLTDAQRLWEVTVGSSSTCKGALANNGGDENDVTIQYAANSCKWTDLQIDPIYDTVNNKMTYTVMAGVAQNPTVTEGDVEIMLTRSQQVEIECEYNAKLEIKYDNLHVSAVNLTAEDQVGTFESGSDDIWKNYFTLSAYKDTNLTEAVTTDNKLTLGNQVYNQITQANFPSTLAWYVESCAAKSDENGTDSVFLFQKYECSNNLFTFSFTDRDVAQAVDKYNFNFQTFVFGSAAADNSVYLTCDIQVCTSGSFCRTAAATQADCDLLGDYTIYQ